MVIDLCSGEPIETVMHPSHSGPSTPPTPPKPRQCRVAAPLPSGGRMFNHGGPLQVGGVETDAKFAFKSLRGCVRNFRVNGEVSLVFLSLKEGGEKANSEVFTCREWKRLNKR